MVAYEQHHKIKLSEFYAELAFEFPNLPSQLFEYYLLRTAREMAREGNLIRRVVIIQPEPCVTTYKLTSPDGMEVCSVLGIRHHHCCFDKEVQRSFVPPVDSVCCSRSQAWYDDADGVIHIPEQGCHGVYFIMVAVCPGKDDCELPDEYMDKFFNTLMMGVKGNIMLITGRPWTNLRVGAACKQEYNNMLQINSIDTATHGMRGMVKIGFPRAL